jgi:ATP-binding cassette subfamily F protein 3
MVEVNVSRLTKHYGGRVVLDGLSWQIGKGDKIGLVGPNGSGKSTLFRLIAGQEELDGGSIHRRPDLTIGHLAQEPDLDPQRTVLEEVMDAFQELARLEEELRRLEALMGRPEVHGDPKRLDRVIASHARLLGEYQERGGPSQGSWAEGTLRSLGFSEEDLGLRTDQLSGGQKKLVGLARILVTRPDLLLLDEPDNHLDLDGKAFLEEYIGGYAGTVVIISHDRYLLDVVAQRIVELEGRRLTEYRGNYSAYALEKRLARARQEKAHQDQQKEIRRTERSIAQLKAWSYRNQKFARRARSKEKALERMERMERPQRERLMGLWMEPQKRGSNKALEVMDLAKSFDDQPIFADVSLLVWHGQRVGLIGPNGSGKSVLFRIILGEETATSGAVKLGPSTIVGYYAQEHDTLDGSRTPLEEIQTVKPMFERQAYNLLGRFLFNFDMAQMKVADLSGGEKSRLQLAKIVIGGANFLLLDEPTNNLDIPSCEVLEEALEDFPGGILTISHDRYFLDRMVDRVLELKDGELTEYHGDYSYYREEGAGSGLEGRRHPLR